MLVPVPRIDDLDAFNRELLELCMEDARREHYRKGLTNGMKFVSAESFCSI